MLIAKRLLGIDYGMRRLGLALSDANQLIASALPLLQAEAKMEQTCVKLLLLVTELEKQYQCVIEGIIIGMPLMMNGRKGVIADEVNAFVQQLSQKTTIKILTWDERLTTVQAERSLREGHMSRKKRSKVVDGVSAVLILQNYLDFLYLQKINDL